MANLIITTDCNLNCSYCFARETRKRFIRGKTEMELSSLVDIMKFLKNSGIDELRLLGGEPSLHPEFPDFIRQGLENGFFVRIFSNGLMKKEILSEISKLPAERVRFVINIIDREIDPAGHLAQERTFSELGPGASVGINICRINQNPGYLIDVINKHNLAPEIRIGLAHPTVPPSNRFLHPKFYHTVGYHLRRFFHETIDHNIQISLDCGFVPCMFPGEMYNMIKSGYGNIGMRCNPVLDILPDGHVISCFPLGNIGKG